MNYSRILLGCKGVGKQKVRNSSNMRKKRKWEIIKWIGRGKQSLKKEIFIIKHGQMVNNVVLVFATCNTNKQSMSMRSLVVFSLLNKLIINF
jgi:hypothetical protein